VKPGTQRRLFFALWPDDEVRHELLHWQTHNLPPSVRWQHRADLHMTLHFLGLVDHARIPALKALGESVAPAAFSIVIDRIGHWPKPRVLWAGPTSVPGDLTDLHARLDDGLRKLGFNTETRSYRPHLTLARHIADDHGLRPLRPLTWLVRELALVESRPGNAPHYHPLARWPLA
jgi:2'-5' RNA ligase